MIRNLKILLVAIVIAGLFTPDTICEHLGFGQLKHHQGSPVKQPKEPMALDDLFEGDFFVNDSLYQWDEQLLRFIAVQETEDFQPLLTAYAPYENSSPPIEIEWKVLMKIKYRLRYFKELDMEMHAPVFNKAQKALDGKEVIIKGFVIPFDEFDEVVSLSANPYASCFFCGNSSPASVISMYLAKQGKRYEIDDFKKFRGTLHLNSDDPDEFYYILREAREER